MRFYVDEDLLGTGYSLMWARRDVIVCGVPLISEEIPRGTADVEWIPKVAAHGWVAITGNERIRSHPVESPVAVEAKLRAVCLHGGRGDLDSWERLSLLVRQFSRIESFMARHPTGPWWLSLTPSGAHELAYAALST